jgi:NADH-quinone oxidoreductase subunit J
MSTFPFAQYLVPAIFVATAAVTLAGALIAVLSTRVIRSVTGLMICCVGLAGLYYFLSSPFLALMEILIYVGAVCVTIVFAVMMAEPDEPAPSGRLGAGLLWTVLAAAVALLIGGALARLSLQGPWPSTPAVLANDGSVTAIGLSLLTTYSLAFETISLVLLVAILGALVIARGGRTAPGMATPATNPPDQTPPAATAAN